MTSRLSDLGVRLVLLDIEGTTTPLSFVHDVLFPYARTHLADWFHASRGSDQHADVVRRLTEEHTRDRGEDVADWFETPNDEQVMAYVRWLMDRDRKSPGLKLLQGFIWEQGYQAGELRGLVYPDVPAAMRRWRDAAIGIAIYSSGSELAQRRLFESTEHGDLTPLIAAFFDTAVGAKTEAGSYRRIASLLRRAPEDILFVSDVAAELSAAENAGCKTRLSLRPGNVAQPDPERFEAVRSLAEI